MLSRLFLQLFELNSDIIPKTYGLGIQIPENADLNDYITPGIYYSPNTSHTSTLKNVPPTVGTGFRLEVKTTTGNNWVKQIVYPNSTNQRTHMRQADGGTDMWGDWNYEIINADLSGVIKTKNISVSVTSGQGTYDLLQIGFDGGKCIPVVYNVSNGINWSDVNASIQNNLLIAGIANQGNGTIEIKVFYFPSEWINSL